MWQSVFLKIIIFKKFIFNSINIISDWCSVYVWLSRTHAQMYTSGEPLLLFSLGAQPLTGRQCEHRKQKPDSLNWLLTRSCRQVVVAKRTVSVSAQWAHCGPQAAGLQDMSSVGLCQYWPICILSYNVYFYCDVWVFSTDNNRLPQCEEMNYIRLQCIKNTTPMIVNLITTVKLSV